ncbi:MAG: hypothetical protein SPK06_07960, partial [Kiritimatiellia bacterium]|nr:hypothetical protein [Kiritimatiellia bacterium]
MPIKQAESRLNFGTVVVAFLFFWLDNPCESSRPMLVIIKNHLPGCAGRIECIDNCCTGGTL